MHIMTLCWYSQTAAISDSHHAYHDSVLVFPDSSLFGNFYAGGIEEGFIRKRRQMSSLLFGGQNSMPSSRLFEEKYDLKKRMNRRTDTLRNVCLKKWMIIRFTPNHHPPKIDFLQKTFLQNILAVIGYCGIQVQYVLPTAACCPPPPYPSLPPTLQWSQL